MTKDYELQFDENVLFMMMYVKKGVYVTQLQKTSYKTLAHNTKATRFHPNFLPQLTRQKN